MDSVFEEAKAVLDQFPVGHAQKIQKRLRAGLFNAHIYMDRNDEGECIACFYGSILYLEGFKGYASYIQNNQLVSDHSGKDFYLQLSKPFGGTLGFTTPLELWLSGEGDDLGIRESDTPETNWRAKALDDFLTDYIADRQMEADPALLERV